MKTRRIVDLDDESNQQIVGGKAYALTRMMRAGFLVPNGFVVSAGASTDMTPALEATILQHFNKLGAEYVAVRSSAINEDGADDAWAGQLDTFLNCTKSTIVQNIKACWQSGNSDRARSYAAQKGISITQIAVIVQEMIPAEVSGVAFSVHPISQDHSQVVIEAGLGLGEAIVAGQITPDTYVINKHTGLVLEHHVSHQARKLTRGHDGDTVWVDAGSRGHAQKLPSQLIDRLRHLVVTIETFFGYPVDVEWALHGNQFYIVQARPVTTLRRV